MNRQYFLPEMYYNCGDYSNPSVRNRVHKKKKKIAQKIRGDY